MSIEYFIKLNFSRLKDLIIDARKRIYFAYPSLHPEIAIALEERLKKDESCDIRVIIDPSEKNFRNGFGDIKALDEIKELGVSIYEVENNLISFIISDESGYFIFPQSRIIEEDGKLINAVRLSKLDMLKILEHFFPPITTSEKDEFINLTSDSHQEIKKELKQLVDNIDNQDDITVAKKLDVKNLERIRKNLELNKPLEPDLKRMIDVYTAKIQFVELSFTGVKFDVKKILIPTETLPIKDERFIQILETKIKLFENLRADNALWKLKWFNNQINLLRKDYTVPMKGRKNKRVIILSKKNEFLSKIDKLKEEVNSIKQEAEVLFNKEIEKAIGTIKDTLTNYLKESKPEYLTDDDKSRKEFVEYLITQINFPSPAYFKEQISLTCNFYDFTWEDLRNDEVLKELMGRKVIANEDYNQIVKMRKVFEVRR